MKKIAIISACFLLAACRKDYSVNPSPFQDKQHVRLVGIDPSKSFVPHCGDQHMEFEITNHYLIPNQIYWWYDIESKSGCILNHNENTELEIYRLKKGDTVNVAGARIKVTNISGNNCTGLDSAQHAVRFEQGQIIQWHLTEK